MNDLFRKLNTLVKAKVSSAFEDATKPKKPSLNPKIDQNIETLRQRINEAIEYEDTLQDKITSMQEEINQLDAQADEAVQQGKDEVARHIIQQIQRNQQRLEMAESDLRAHQIVAQDLIQKVNLLEATVADTKKAQEDDFVSEAREKNTGVSEQIKSRLNSSDEPPTDNAKVDDDLTARRQRLSK